MSGYLTGATAHLQVSFGNHSAGSQEARTWSAYEEEEEEEAAAVAGVAAPSLLSSRNKGAAVAVPASTEVLYTGGLAGVTLGVKLRYPGPRLNVTTQNIVDVSHLSLSVRENTEVQLWLGIQNPFSVDVVMRDINIDTYWALAPDPTVPLTQAYNHDKFIALKPNDVTLIGTSNTTHKNQLHAYVDVAHNLRAATMMMEQMAYHPKVEGSGYMMMSLSGTFTLSIGSYTVIITYHQGETPTCNLPLVRDTGSCLGRYPTASSISNDCKHHVTAMC